MEGWASLPFIGIATLLDSSGSVPAIPPLLLRLLSDDIAVSRSVREAALRVLHAILLAANDEQSLVYHAPLLLSCQHVLHSTSCFGG